MFVVMFGYCFFSDPDLGLEKYPDSDPEKKRKKPGKLPLAKDSDA